MKYIRTKEAIIKYGEHKLGVKFTDNFIKERVADTIEELCDEFVGIDSQGHYIIHNDQWLEGARIIPLEEITYYGAIWTEWGLKYVAKMNEKGELELL